MNSVQGFPGTVDTVYKSARYFGWRRHFARSAAGCPAILTIWLRGE